MNRSSPTYHSWKKAPKQKKIHFDLIVYIYVHNFYTQELTLPFMYDNFYFKWGTIVVCSDNLILIYFCHLIWFSSWFYKYLIKCKKIYGLIFLFLCWWFHTNVVLGCQKNFISLIWLHFVLDFESCIWIPLTHFSSKILFFLCNLKAMMLFNHVKRSQHFNLLLLLFNEFGCR